MANITHNTMILWMTWKWFGKKHPKEDWKDCLNFFFPFFLPEIIIIPFKTFWVIFSTYVSINSLSHKGYRIKNTQKKKGATIS